MKSFKVFLIVLSLLVLSACQSPFSRFTTTEDSSGYGYAGSNYPEAMMDKTLTVNDYDVAYESQGSSAYSPEVDRKLIKTGSLELHVESVRDTAAEMQTYVESLLGTISDSSISRGDNSYSGYLTARVPSDKFDEAINGLKDMAVYVDYEYTNANDITEYYTDLEQRLANKKAEEQQYLDILDNAVTVTDLLSVTNYLSDVRYEIESLQGQINSYDAQSDYSTISVTLTEDESVSAVTETWRPLGTIKDALSSWVGFLQGSVDFVIYLIIFLWPFVLIGFGIRYYLKRRKHVTRK